MRLLPHKTFYISVPLLMVVITMGYANTHSSNEIVKPFKFNPTTATEVIFQDDARELVIEQNSVFCSNEEIDTADMAQVLYSGCQLVLTFTTINNEAELVIDDNPQLPALSMSPEIAPVAYYAHSRVGHSVLSVSHPTSFFSFRVMGQLNAKLQTENLLLVTQHSESKNNIELNVFRC